MPMLKSVTKTLMVILIGFISHQSMAQLTDLVRLEYSFIPKSNSEDRYTRVRALFNYPIKTKQDCYLVIGGEYNQIFLNLEDDYPFDTSLIESVKVIDLNIGYTFKTNENWRIGLNLNPRIASTFTSSLESDDFFINGGVFAIHDRTNDESLNRPYRLTLGLTYNATIGIPFPLPFINYYRRINENWSFSAGIPKSNVKYFFSEKSVLQSFVGLDGYFAHIQRPLLINGTQVDNVSLSVIVGGLGYEYFMTKHIVTYAYAGYTFRLNNVLRNDNRDEVFKLDDLNAFYLRTGIKFKL